MRSRHCILKTARRSASLMQCFWRCQDSKKIKVSLLFTYLEESMEPWYKVVIPRKEVREGRSFNPDEFAIALEQVVAGTATDDYRDPAQFFARTCFTRALRDHPWIDIARQLAGDKGVEALGPAAKTTPPGTESIARVFQAAGAPVLLLFDEVLNFLNRHRGSAESFHAFIQNLTVATTGTTHGATVISLPRSQVEMTDWDMEWQDRISKVVRRVAKDLIANDETEISEVVRRRLFQDLGSEKIRKNVAKAFGDWCFERRAQLPPEWTAVDTAATEAKAREFLC